MKDWYKIIIITMVISPFLIYGQEKEEFNYEFIRGDNSYSFRGSFLVKVDLDSLIPLIYEFENISKYALGAKSIELVRQGENWYDVTYTYRKLIFLENTSTWRRTLKRDEHQVVFKMISSSSNSGLVPKMLSSTGYYQLKPGKESCRVEYFQECKLNPGPLKKIYMKKVKKETIKFLHVFKNYLDGTFDNSNDLNKAIQLNNRLQ